MPKNIFFLQSADAAGLPLPRRAHNENGPQHLPTRRDDQDALR